MKKLFLILLSLTAISVFGQINPTTLKTTIDSHVTNKPAGTVLRSQVGADMKLIVDYATEQSALKQNVLISGTNIKTIESQSLLSSGNIDITKSDVGLSNVDNTSDLSKPVSTAQSTAINVATLSTTKVYKTTITQLQILNLYTTPITILPASTNSGIHRQLVNVMIRRSGAGTNYSVAGQLVVSLGNLSSYPIQNLNNYVLSTTNYNSFGVPDTNYIFQNDTTTYPNVYKLSILSSNPTGGTGNIDVYVHYIEITL